jgi:hypothetical protein
LSPGAARTLRVVGVRHDLSRWYGGQWVWVEGHEVERPGENPPGHRMQILIRVAAIPAAARDPQWIRGHLVGTRRRR